MIGIIDYGLGNIKAFANLYKRLNIPHLVVDAPGKLEKASKIILPGVGTFDYAINLLNRSGMRDMLEEMVKGKSVPVLGVCVGMQIMAESSEEGKSEGLGWIPGAVLRFPEHVKPLPHMGWNQIEIQHDDPIFVGLDPKARFYFLHSFYFECDEPFCLAVTDYRMRFVCVARHRNVYGIQFHPEKSHAAGISILKNFANS